MSLKLFASTFLFFTALCFTSASSLGTTEWNVTVNGTGSVTDYQQIDHAIAEFDVLANVSATRWWAEVNLSTNKVDFGRIEKGNKTTIEYKIWARGNVDIKVKPQLENGEDSLFSKYLFFSRTPISGFDEEESKIGEYAMRFNLTENKSNWLAIGPSGMETGKITNGKQYIRLDLADFNEILPFDETRTNKVKFVITPIWSSVEPV